MKMSCKISDVLETVGCETSERKVVATDVFIKDFDSKFELLPFFDSKLERTFSKFFERTSVAGGYTTF